MQRRRTDAVGGERASGHLHAVGGPPAERALSVADVLLGQVEAHVERGYHVHGVRIEAGQSNRRGRVGLRRGQLREAVDCGGLVRHDAAVHAHGRIGGVGMHRGIDGEPFAMLLEFGRPFGKLVDVLLRFLEQVPFDAHVAEEGHGHAHLLGGGAMRGVSRGRAHVLADHLRRHEQRRVTLDVGAFHRVDAVGAPDAVGDFEDAEVDAAAAGGAAFDFQTGMGRFQVSEDPVHGERLVVHGGASGARRHRFGDVFVVVPFDVVDAEFADELVHGAVDVRVRVRIGEVDNLLGAPLHRQTVGGGLQHPVGVGAEHVGIRVDHFRLEPQTELHALAVHVVGERLEGLVSVRPDVLGDLPIAQTGSVVTACAKPTVIHDEAFHTAFHGLVGERGQSIVIMVEVNGLPRVEDDRARLGRDAVVHEPVAVHAADVAVEAGGDFVESFSVGADEPWRGVAFAVFQADFAAEQHFAAADDAGGVGQSFRGQHAVAAPCHVRGVDVAVGEAEAVFADTEQQGRIEVRTADHGGFGEASDGEILALRGTFTQVVACGGENFVGVGGHGEGEFDLADLKPSLAGVRHFGMLADEAGFVEFARPREFHALFHVFGSDGDGGRLLGFGGHVPVGISVLFGHGVGFAGGNGFGFDVSDLELAEEFHAIAAHVEAIGSGPCLGLRGQHARPCGVVECAGDALRSERVEGVDHGFRSGERTAPMHEPRQVVAGEHQGESDVRRRLLGVDGGERSAVGSGAVEDLNERHCNILT